MFMHVIAEFWLPILVSAAAVFVASSLLWAILPWHRNDYAALPDEDAAQAGLGAELAPGLYALPCAPTKAAMEKAEVKARIERGPMALVTVLSPDVFAMGKRFSFWFAYNLAVAVCCALLVEISLIGLADGDPRIPGIVLHMVGFTTFLAYGGAYVAEAVWFSRTWRVVAKYLVDAAIYAGLTAAAFIGLM